MQSISEIQQTAEGDKERGDHWEDGGASDLRGEQSGELLHLSAKQKSEQSRKALRPNTFEKKAVLCKQLTPAPVFALVVHIPKRLQIQFAATQTTAKRE